MKHPCLIACLVTMSLSSAVAGEGGKTLASTLEIYVFPADGQTADQQSKDEAASHQATQEKTNNFKKAFGVCLEAKDYMVK
jgi:hypothetical protein